MTDTQAAPQAETKRRELILEFHGYRKLRPDDKNELVVLFCFSLMPAEWRRSGEEPKHEDFFWTEVALPRELAERPGWKKLSTDEKIRALFQHAVEQIRLAGRKLRQAPIVVTPTSPLRDGPPWDLKSIPFPKAPPMVIEVDEESLSAKQLAKVAAGHIKKK